MKYSKILIFAVSMTWLAACAQSQNYPTKPVKVIIPFTEGSATDFVGRTVGNQLSKIWGQSVLFENQAGAGSTLGTDAVSKSPADGYTLLENSGSFAVAPALHSQLTYDPLSDFVGITALARQPMALVVSASAGMNSMADVIEKAKAESGKIQFGSPGTGSTAHLAAEKFNSAAGINAVHVPYKGGPETIAALADGTVSYAFLPLALAMKAVKAGELLALAVTSEERTGSMPDVPTVAEGGLPGFESSVWWGVWAPRGTPANVAAQLEKDISSALAASEVLEQFDKRGIEVMKMTSAEFNQFVRSEMEDVARIVKEAGIAPK